MARSRLLEAVHSCFQLNLVHPALVGFGQPELLCSGCLQGFQLEVHPVLHLWRKFNQ